MEPRMNVEYNQVLSMVKQLPDDEKKRLTLEIEKDLKEKSERKMDVDEFRAFLLKGPVMSNEQFNDFKELRKDFARWLEK